jgi:hypothetical protein
MLRKLLKRLDVNGDAGQCHEVLVTLVSPTIPPDGFYGCGQTVQLCLPVSLVRQIGQ